MDIGMPAEQAVVKNIQKYLNANLPSPLAPIAVNGVYDAKTEGLAQKILGVKTISYSLYKEILSKL